MESEESGNDADHGVILFILPEEDCVPQSKESSTEVCSLGALRGL
jgi:hypothetical protein